mmetsp:Transcript_43429/g.102292  ORF Transcript_43429/g.102292 Transcript_43429/m.102292 type:complete len:316 (+) Transcript_43429:90-1037(+)
MARARGRLIVALAFATAAIALEARHAFAVARAAGEQQVREGGLRSHSRRVRRSDLKSPPLVVRHQAATTIAWPKKSETEEVEILEHEKLEVGGPKTRACFTAFVAGFAALSLHTADAITKRTLGLPLWAGPSAGVCVMFAVAAVSAADQGTLTDFPGVFKFAVQVATAVTGSCAFAVFASSYFSSLAIRRALSVSICAAWMLFNPASAVFPPSAGYCALYIDQLLAGGPLGKLSYVFGVFPCALGVMVVLLSTRFATVVAAGPLRALWVKRLQRRRRPGYRSISRQIESWMPTAGLICAGLGLSRALMLWLSILK